MPVQVVRQWTNEVPEAWETALRAISPVSRVVPWLAIRWFPMVRTNAVGVREDCGRWLLSECVPEEVIPEQHRDMVGLLSGQKPSTLPPAERTQRLHVVNDYQWQMYRDHRVWARELWVVQGEQGGHPTDYHPGERKLLQLQGLPTDPPRLGSLAYAPVDQRVLEQMLRRNRLIALRNSIDALRRSGDPAQILAEEAQQAKHYRSEYVRFLTEQSRATADLTHYFSGKSENRDVVRQATPGEITAAARLKDEYVETGHIPSAA